MVDIGMVLPQPMKPPQKLVEYGRKYSKNGLDVWNYDHIYSSGKGITPETWSILNAVGLKTESNDAKIGTSVTDPHRYHPAVLSQRLATYTHLFDNKIVLGLGVGETMNLDPYGIKWNKPVTRTKEAIDVLKGLWSASPEDPFYYDGMFHQLENASLQINPKSKIPIYLAANGPQMRGIAGRKADGWICAFVTPEIFGEYRGRVEKGLSERSEIDFGEFNTCVYLFTAVADDKNEALERLKPARYLITWPDEVEKAGYDIDIPSELEDIHYTSIPAQDESKLKKLKELGQVFPEEVCLEFTVSGDAEDCIEKIEEYEKLGVDDIILYNFSEDLDGSLEVYSEKIVPYFQDY